MKGERLQQLGRAPFTTVSALDPGDLSISFVRPSRGKVTRRGRKEHLPQSHTETERVPVGQPFVGARKRAHRTGEPGDARRVPSGVALAGTYGRIGSRALSSAVRAADS